METARMAHVSRNTKETQIEVELGLEGEGNYTVNTGIPFFNHLLELFAKHGRFDLNIHAEGDIEVDVAVEFDWVDAVDRRDRRLGQDHVNRRLAEELPDPFLNGRFRLGNPLAADFDGPVRYGQDQLAVPDHLELTVDRHGLIGQGQDDGRDRRHVLLEFGKNELLGFFDGLTSDHERSVVVLAGEFAPACRDAVAHRERAG